jgi:hypothetical protein
MSYVLIKMDETKRTERHGLSAENEQFNNRLFCAEIICGYLL